MAHANNVVDFTRFKNNERQELVDDICANAFMMLRHSAEEHDLPIKSVLLEHLMGIGAVIKAVEGKEEVQRVFREALRQLETD